MRSNRPLPSKKLRLPSVRVAGAIVKAWAKAALIPICATAARASWRQQKWRGNLLRAREYPVAHYSERSAAESMDPVDVIVKLARGDPSTSLGMTRVLP